MKALIDAVRQDVGYALRGLRRSPGLTITIIATFAIGVGVNSAMFTVIDRVFFQAPPRVADPGAVRRLIHRDMGFGNEVFTTELLSPQDQHAFREVVGSTAEIEGYTDRAVRIGGESGAQRTVGYATTGFFRLTRIRPHRGRFFTPDENRFGNPSSVVVLGYHLWRDAFAADSAILGRAIRIDTTLFTVIGIAERGFEGMNVDVVDAWVPLASFGSGGEGNWWNGDFQMLTLFARLSPRADDGGIGARLDAVYRAGRLNTARDSVAHLELAPLLQARAAVWRGAQRTRDLALMVRLAGVAMIVLVIAMSNVASLLLMRALRRGREIALRVALGVSRRRLLGQLIIESVVLAIVGGAVALLMAYWSGGVLRTLLASDFHWSATVIDRRVLLFTAIVAVVAGIGAALAPATIALRRDIMALLKAGSAESGRPRSALRVALLAGQTALCMVMLVSAGVFLQSVNRAGDVDVGFDRDRLITFRMSRTPLAVVSETMDRIRGLPTVASVSRSDLEVRGTGGMAGVYFANGDSVPSILGPMVGYVDAAYAGTVGLRLVKGRLFASGDMDGGQPVVLINQAMADAYWPRGNALGECFANRRNDPCARIVGIVGNIRWDLSLAPMKTFYVPPPARLPNCCNAVVVRTRGPATPATVAAIRGVVATTSPAGSTGLPVPRLVTERLEPIMRPWRVAAAMFLAFGLLALAAAGAGIYGLVGYEVTQRTHEFGVRITLGATAENILGLVIGSGLRVVALGLVAGIVGAVATGRVLASLLFETSPYDPLVLVATAVALSLVALLASLVPAWRATRVDPVVALRTE